MSDYGPAADFMEEKGLFPDAVLSLRLLAELDGTFEQFVVAAHNLLEGSMYARGHCARCEEDYPDHDDDCGHAYLVEVCEKILARQKILKKRLTNLPGD